MARQIILPDGSVILEAGTEEYILPDGSVINEDQAVAGGTHPVGPLGHPLVGPLGGPLG